MDRLENVSPPDQRKSDGPPVAPPVVGAHVSPKFCEDCGAKVEGHGCDKLQGLYYCRSCYGRRRSLVRFRDGVLRVVTVILGFLALCALILLALFITDDFR
jgi:hypothetical protein